MTRCWNLQSCLTVYVAEFVLAVGNDSNDEEMFTTLHDLLLQAKSAKAAAVMSTATATAGSTSGEHGVTIACVCCNCYCC